MVFIIDPQNAGIAGNMIAGAMIDLGANSKKMKEIMEFATEDFGGTKVNINKINKKGIESTYLEVIIDKHHSNSISSISYSDFLDKINNINNINSSSSSNCNSSNGNNNNNYNLIDNNIMEMAKNIFKKIAIAEAKIHGQSLDKVHFHEVGAADAVADVFGSVFGYFDLGMDKEKVIGLPIALGGGTIESVHGRIPIPAPATLELLNQTQGINSFGGPIATELATPTGIAILTEICDEFKDFQPMLSPKNVGYGAGKKDFDFPNVLRIMKGSSVLPTSQIDVIETNVDHLSGEILGYLFDKLLKVGARDVAITPTIMKKGRPGHLIKVIAKQNDTEAILSAIFEETGTLGIRVSPQTHRGIAKREIISLKIEINGKNHNVRFKIGTYNNKIISARPEYEDIKKIAIEDNIPLKDIEKIAKLAIDDNFNKK